MFSLNEIYIHLNERIEEWNVNLFKDKALLFKEVRIPGCRKEDNV